MKVCLYFPLLAVIVTKMEAKCILYSFIFRLILQYQLHEEQVNKIILKSKILKIIHHFYSYTMKLFLLITAVSADLPPQQNLVPLAELLQLILAMQHVLVVLEQHAVCAHPLLLQAPYCLANE